MDLSPYYEEFQSTYKLAVFTVCLAVFAVIFVGVRAWRDKKDTKKTKILCTVLLALLLTAILIFFATDACARKRDVDEKTIYCYEGFFEIIETSNDFYSEAIFLFEDQEIALKYPFKDSKYDVIAPGKYTGKFVYAYHLGSLLEFEIYESCVD